MIPGESSLPDKNPDPRYRIIIVLSGQILSDPGLLLLLDRFDVLICADGGARHLHRVDCLPDMLVGDLDSIDPLDLQWIKDNQIPIQRYPSAKDLTDAELAIELALQLLKEKLEAKHSGTDTSTSPAPPVDPGQIEIVILAALGGRPDHVLSNQLMAVQIAEQGYPVLMSDGVTRIYPIVGPTHLKLAMPDLPIDALSKSTGSARAWAVSAIPISPEVTGLTYEGLRYPLTHATLPRGSCRGVSNRPINGRSITIELTSGSLLLIITPEN